MKIGDVVHQTHKTELMVVRGFETVGLEGGRPIFAAHCEYLSTDKRHHGEPEGNPFDPGVLELALEEMIAAARAEMEARQPPDFMRDTRPPSEQ